MLPVGQICLVIGTPRGFTRSVLEALLKRGSRVILACPDTNLGFSEHKRLSGLYGSSQISVSVVQGSNLRMLESLLLRALDTHGGVTHIVNSTADNKLIVDRCELDGPRESVENYLNLKQQQHEVQSIKDISKLAVKYLGKQWFQRRQLDQPGQQDRVAEEAQCSRPRERRGSFRLYQYCAWSFHI